MMNKMIVANLVHRPVRSLISIVAIALEVTLILLISDRMGRWTRLATIILFIMEG